MLSWVSIGFQSSFLVRIWRKQQLKLIAGPGLKDGNWNTQEELQSKGTADWKKSECSLVLVIPFAGCEQGCRTVTLDVCTHIRGAFTGRN